MEKALKQLASAFQELGESLSELAVLFNEIEKQNERAYKEAGYPFGTSTEGYDIWIEHCEFTTIN